MGVFWIHLTTLVLLLQTIFGPWPTLPSDVFGPWPTLPSDGTSKLSSVGGETTKADLADMSDVVVLNGIEGGSVTFPINSTGAKAALLSDDKNVKYGIVTVEFGVHPRVTVHGHKLKDRVAVSEDGRALIIFQLRMEDAGIYYFKINGKTSTFILRVFRELAEPTVTHEAQNSSDGSCSSSLHCSVPGVGFGEISYTWRVGNQLLAEGPVLLVNESLLDKLELLTCRVQNPVSSRSVTVTTPRVLCVANTTHPPSSGSDSSSSVLIVVIAVLGALMLVLVLIFLYRYKSRVKLCLKGRCRSSAGHCRIASDNQDEESAGEPGADQPLGATQHYQNFPLINLRTSEATNTNSLPDQVKTHEENNMGH